MISSYLRNERTDALLLEKMRNYLDMSDVNVASEFFKANRAEAMQIAIENLNNRNSDIRGCAVSILRNATGQNFGFDPDQYHGRQNKIIQQWKDYLAEEF